MPLARSELPRPRKGLRPRLDDCLRVSTSLFCLVADADNTKGDCAMTDRSDRTPSAFRLNLEQQGKRAKELVKAARAGDAEALARLAVHRASSTPGLLKLADAQFTIARELGFSTWSQLKSHIAVMDGEYAAMARPDAALDGDLRTLHVRCGSDIQPTLLAAGV